MKAFYSATGKEQICVVRCSNCVLTAIPNPSPNNTNARTSQFPSTMNPSPPMISAPIKATPFFIINTSTSSYRRLSAGFNPHGHRTRHTSIAKCSRPDVPLAPQPTHSSSSSSSSSSPPPPPPPPPVVNSSKRTKIVKLEALEEKIEKVIYGCRFLAILGVFGSLVGSFLCFIKGCTYVVSSFMQYFVNRGKVIILLVESIDVYLLGTVMLVFGMGLYELFVSNLDIAKLMSEEKAPQRSNLFGLFTLKERPKWLEVKTVNELKTKLGHVIVMLLLIGFFEKCKTAAIHSPMDLLCFSTSVLLCSGCLYLLSKLSDN